MSLETDAGTNEMDLSAQKDQPGGLIGFISRYFASHPIGFWFFFWGEFAERCSYYGMRAILAKYMADQLGLGQDDASTYMSFFIAACYFLPLAGGWVADNLFGKYWTIVGFSIPYILGHVILGIENFTAMVIALSLLAMGSGVIKPNISTLMGLTYDQQRPGQSQLRSDAFALFYFAINIGAALSQFAMPPIRTNYSYRIAFLFPAALMVVAFLIFAAGKRFYAVEAVRSEASRTPEERAEQWKVLSRIFGLFVLVMFFWAIFDQASSTWIFFTEACMNRHIFGTEMDADQMQFFNPVLILILLPPIKLLENFLKGRGVRIRATDKMLAGFLLTAGCMGVMALAAFLAGPAEQRPGIVEPRAGDKIQFVVEGEKEFVFNEPMKIDATSPYAVVASYELKSGADNEASGSVTLTLTGDGVLKLLPGTNTSGPRTLQIEGNINKLTRATKEQKERGAKPVTTKETLLEGTLKAHIAGEFETSNRWYVAPAEQVTVWWLVFAYTMITIAEVLISVTGLELAYTAAPKSMTSVVTACWLLTVGLANLLINAPVTRLYARMQPMKYFGMLSATLLIVSIAFLFMARRFNQYAREQAAE
jgi:POT family proton-dependent oligopeptide transporter